jgi:acetyl esterase/lipase
LKKWIVRVATGFAALLFLAAGITYSWTFTPAGRLDYAAAVLAKLATWSAQDAMDFSEGARRAANAATRRMQGSTTARDDVRFEDREIPALDGAKIPIRIYWPPAARGDRKPPVYLNIHGGGWWMGDGFLFHSATTRFAAESGATSRPR